MPQGALNFAIKAWRPYRAGFLMAVQPVWRSLLGLQGQSFCKSRALLAALIRARLRQGDAEPSPNQPHRVASHCWVGLHILGPQDPPGPPAHTRGSPGSPDGRQPPPPPAGGCVGTWARSMCAADPPAPGVLHRPRDGPGHFYATCGGSTSRTSRGAEPSCRNLPGFCAARWQLCGFQHYHYTARDTCSTGVHSTHHADRAQSLASDVSNCAVARHPFPGRPAAVACSSSISLPLPHASAQP